MQGDQLGIYEPDLLHIQPNGEFLWWLSNH